MINMKKLRGWTGSAAARTIGLSLATLVCAAAPLSVVKAEGRADSLGTEFWVGFPTNEGPATLSLFVSSDDAAMGTVEIPGLGFATTFTVVPGVVTTVALPPNAQNTTYGTVTNLGVHVTASSEVSVYGLSRRQFTTDAYLGLPVDVLGMEYVALGYSQLNASLPSQAMVVATQDGTRVESPGLNDCAPFDVTLNTGQSYLVGCQDVSGMPFSASAPVALFAGGQCPNIPVGVTFCDHVVEQMTPSETWGSRFLTVPLATRIGGDTFRFLAQADNTTVSINGSVVATLAAGQFHEQIVEGASEVESSAPILVAQYSNGTTFDGVTSDPFELLVPPFEQFLNAYTVTTPESGFRTNFINVTARTDDVGTVMLDGAVIDPTLFSPIGSSNYSGAQIPVELGSHTLSSTLPFGVSVYGYDSFDSYGYPGGLSLAPIAIVSSLELTPATATYALDTEACVEANVADQDANPLADIRVDFEVNGVNPNEGFANTDDTGVAMFCYVGIVAGSDLVTASVGNLSAMANVEWQDPQLETVLDASALITSTTRTSLFNLFTRATVRFEATLTAEGNPVPGKPVVFTAGSQSCTGTTNASGLATCGVTIGGLLATVLNLGFDAEFTGDDDFLPSSDSGGLLRATLRARL